MSFFALDFNSVQTVMKDYELKLNKEREPYWKLTAARVLTVALFSLGMIAFLSTSVVGLPGWMVVATFVGWAVCTLLSTIWMKKLASKETEYQKNLHTCRVINYQEGQKTKLPSDYVAQLAEEQQIFKEKFNEIPGNYPSQGIEKKIINYCRYIKYSYELKKAHDKDMTKVSELMGKVFSSGQ